jgi:hypothetical protein
MTEIVLGIVGWTLTARHIGYVPVWHLSWRVLFAGLVMAAAIYPLRNLGGVAMAIPIVLGVAVYSGAVLLLRALTKEEIDWARRALAAAR